MLRNGPFWMLAGAVLVLFFLPLGPFWFQWAVFDLHWGRFGRFPISAADHQASLIYCLEHTDDLLRDITEIVYDVAVILQVGSTFLEPFWWISSLAPWTRSGPVHSARSSVRTTSCSVRAVLATTGPRVTTRRAPSWWTRCSTSSARSRRAATVCRASR